MSTMFLKEKGVSMFISAYPFHAIVLLLVCIFLIFLLREK